MAEPTPKYPAPETMRLQAPNHPVLNALAMQGKDLREKSEDLDNRLTTLEGHKLPSRVAFIYTAQQKSDRAIIRMSDILDDIAKRIERNNDAPNGCWDWSQFNREEAAQAWEDMLRWRREVFQARWPEQFRLTTKACWYLHPAAVEAMSALYTSWDWTFHDKLSNPTRVADWIRYTMPNLADAIKAELVRCTQAHVPNVPLGRHQMEDDAELSAFITEDLNVRPPAPPKEEPQPQTTP